MPKGVHEQHVGNRSPRTEAQMLSIQQVGKLKGRQVLTRLAPTEHPTNLDISWAAGIFEGEGSARNQNIGRGKGAHVQVSQKDTWLLYRLKSMFGGSVASHTRHSCSEWNLCGARARGFLYTIFTFLSPRRRVQVRAALGVS